MSIGDEHVTQKRGNQYSSQWDDSLLNEFSLREEELTVILNNKNPDDREQALIRVKELGELSKQLNTTLAQQGIETQIKPKYTEREVRKVFLDYRDKQESESSSGEEDDKSVIVDSPKNKPVEKKRI